VSLKVWILLILREQLLILVIKVFCDSDNGILVGTIELDPFALHGFGEPDFGDFSADTSLHL